MKGGNVAKNDGGQAFPRAGFAFPEIGSQSEPGTRGMTLRDWFAGMALQGILASALAKPELGMEIFVEDAYSVADKMIAKRSE